MPPRKALTGSRKIEILDMGLPHRGEPCLDMLEKKKITGDYTISDDPDPEEHTVQVPSSDAGPERQLLSREANEKIAVAMRLLTPTERIAFTLRHMEGQFEEEEISKALKVKENAAKNTIFRAVKKLRVNLEPLVNNTTTD